MFPRFFNDFNFQLKLMMEINCQKQNFLVPLALLVHLFSMKSLTSFSLCCAIFNLMKSSSTSKFSTVKDRCCIKLHFSNALNQQSYSAVKKRGKYHQGSEKEWKEKKVLNEFHLASLPLRLAQARM